MAEIITSSLLSLLLVLLTFCADRATPQSVSQNGAVCRTPDDVQGICINIKQCPSAIELLRQKPLSSKTVDYLRKSQCGFDKGYPHICCPNRTEELYPPDVTGHANMHLIPQDKCGFYTQDRLIGGETASLWEFPWLALISYNTPNGSRFLCGGSVINDRYILTAAHCITQLENDITLAGVRLGEYNIDTVEDCEDFGEFKECAMPVQELSIERVIPHPDYSKGKHDIGLLRLKERITFGEDIQPICLPLGNLKDVNLDDKHFMIAGWGTSESGPAYPVLRKGSPSVVPNSECTIIYNLFTDIKPQYICAGGIRRKDACYGDSGGPLMLLEHIEDNVKMVQRGIMKFVPKNCSIESLPNIYTNIAFYTDWILENIEA